MRTNLLLSTAVLPLMFLMLAGCSSAPSKTDGGGAQVHQVGENAQDKFEDGMQALNQKNYAQAAEIFDHLADDHPASQFDLISIYNAGLAHEMMGDCKAALHRYRQIVQGSTKTFQRILSQALYRMSMAYECLGNEKMTILALLDTSRRSRYLPDEVAKAELPARLAVAYARTGQRQRALHYFKMASNGLKKVLSSRSRSSAEAALASRVLYSMGQLTVPQRNLTAAPDAYLKGLSLQQPYLLQSAELGYKPYSINAADDLKFAYENVLKLVPAKDADARVYLENALQDMAELKKIRLPESGNLVNEIFDVIGKQEKKVKARLVTLSDLTPLTPTAKKREGLRRKGHVK